MGEQVGGGFVADLVQQREDAAGGAHHGFLALDQLPDHLLGFRHAFLFLDGRQAGVGGVGAGRREAQGPDALGDVVHGNGQFGVLTFEHQVQRIEHRAGDVPVEVVGFQVEGVGVGQ